MKYDSHVHIGFFKNKEKTFYFDPLKVITDLQAIGLTDVVVMSTTQNAGVDSFTTVLKEFRVIERTEINIYPTLWCLPEMLDNFGFYNSAYHWKALKLHTLSQNWKDFEIEKLFTFAAKYQLPIIIHTGFSKMSGCRRFEKFIKKFETVNVILAHGHPEIYAEELVSTYKNCYLDTAFQPSIRISHLLNSTINSKVLYGSDYPVQYTYPETNILLKELGKSMEIFEKNNDNSPFITIFNSQGKKSDIQTNK